ncbi:MAG TPA: endonuclease [Marmoricola sp.]|nr:endonuclease [Marmoricola sp.]
MRADVEELLAEHGRTWVDQAGIRLRDKPAPLFQLLVLSLLASTRISADIAVDAARELFRAGWRTPRRMRASTWQERVDALGRGGYRRYDESTATALDEACTLLLEEHRGDLRRIRPASTGQDAAALEEALTRFKRIGPAGAGIFCREVQAVWPEVAPYFDDRARDEAGRRGLPRDPAALAALVDDDPAEIARLAAALVRAGRGRGRHH